MRAGPRRRERPCLGAQVTTGTDRGKGSTGQLLELLQGPEPMKPEGSGELVVASSGEPVRVHLTVPEVSRLVELEAVVDRERDALDRVLAALEEIRSGRLYRATHATFRDYLKERFGFSPSYASRLRRAGAVVEEARRLSPDVAHGQPPAERAVREVNDLPAEEAARVLVVATESARDEGREVATVADVRKARGGKLEANRGFRAIPRRPAMQRAESVVSSLEVLGEELSEIGPERVAKERPELYRRLRAAVEKFPVENVGTTSPMPEAEDGVDPRLAELDKLLAALSKPGRGKKAQCRAVVVLGKAIVRLVHALGEIAAHGEINFGNRPEYLDAIAETMTEAIAAVERKRPVETVAVPPAPAGQTCVRCNATAPLGERIPHRAPCVKAPVVVAGGQVWKTKHGKLFLVERVEGEKTVVNLGDGQPSGWTETAKVLGEATLVAKPTKAVLAKFERAIMEFDFKPRRRSR